MTQYAYLALVFPRMALVGEKSGRLYILLPTTTAPGLAVVAAEVVNYQRGQQWLEEVGGSSP